MGEHVPREGVRLGAGGALGRKGRDIRGGGRGGMACQLLIAAPNGPMVCGTAGAEPRIPLHPPSTLHL